MRNSVCVCGGGGTLTHSVMSHQCSIIICKLLPQSRVEVPHTHYMQPVNRHQGFLGAPVGRLGVASVSPFQNPELTFPPPATIKMVIPLSG